MCSAEYNLLRFNVLKLQTFCEKEVIPMDLEIEQ